MKKLLFVPVALALVAPLSICTNNFTDTANAQVPTMVSSALPSFAVLTKDWYHYTASDGSYSALFPGQPEESVESDFVRVTYNDHANNRSYLTYNGKLRANPNPNEVEKAFDAGVASIIQDGFTVSDQKKLIRQGFPGREIIARGIKGSLKGTVVKMQMFIDPKEPAMYMSVVVAENGNLDFPEAQAFLDSVSIPQKQSRF